MDAILTAEQRKSLMDALGEAQRIGLLGANSLEKVIDRSSGFIRLLPEGAHSVVDLGSGGGDPGLVIAVGCPWAKVTLVDRRAKRTDILTRLVGRLGLSGRVEVVESDVALIPRLFPGRQWDVATSRGFGSPDYTAAHAAPLVAIGGRLLVTEPPNSDGERWKAPEVVASGFVLDRVQGGIAVLIRSANPTN